MTSGVSRTRTKQPVISQGSALKVVGVVKVLKTPTFSKDISQKSSSVSKESVLKEDDGFVIVNHKDALGSTQNK